MFLIEYFGPWRESTPKSSRIAKKVRKFGKDTVQTSVVCLLYRAVMWAVCHLLRCLTMQKRTAEPVMPQLLTQNTKHCRQNSSHPLLVNGYATTLLAVSFEILSVQVTKIKAPNCRVEYQLDEKQGDRKQTVQKAKSKIDTVSDEVCIEIRVLYVHRFGF